MTMVLRDISETKTRRMEKCSGPKVERLVGLERARRVGFQVNIQPTLYQGDSPPLYTLLNPPPPNHHRIHRHTLHHHRDSSAGH